MTAREFLTGAGFTGDPLDTALGIAWAESDRYADAVGDYAQLADPAVAAKWGPSVGLWQIRTLRDPDAWGWDDKVRRIEELRAVAYQAHAVWIISKGGADFTPWTVYRTGTYLQHKGEDFTPRTGHPQAARWNIDGAPA